MYEDIAIWSQDFTVTHYFVDPDGRASIHGLAFFLQEAAHHHANARSLGFEDLIKDNKTWVLTRQAIKFNRIPFLGQEVKVETWVKDTTQSFSIRDFHIIGPDGEILVIARTSWMMFDIIQRRPVKITEDVLNKIPLTPGRLKEDLSLVKLNHDPVDSDNEIFHVKYSDLDMNNHVNNITYVRWIMDGFDLSFRKSNRIISLELNYLNEALYGDPLTANITYSKKDDFYHTLIRRNTDNKEIAVARTIWKNKKG